MHFGKYFRLQWMENELDLYIADSKRGKNTSAITVAHVLLLAQLDDKQSRRNRTGASASNCNEKCPFFFLVIFANVVCQYILLINIGYHIAQRISALL